MRIIALIITGIITAAVGSAVFFRFLSRFIPALQVGPPRPVV